MLRIHIAVLALFVVARARPESGNTQITLLPVASNSIKEQCCSCSHNSTIRQIMTSISMLKCGSTPPPKPKRDDYDYSSGMGGYKLHTRAKSWNEARRICDQEGGHLAIINSQAEAKVLEKLFEKGEAIIGSLYPQLVSIGFHDLYKEGEYVTIHGQSIARAGYTRWAPSEPNNAEGNENCGSMYWNGWLNDIDCESPYGFICELSDVCTAP